MAPASPHAPDALIFVYNAEAGLLNGLMDSVHKTVSPATYDCALCAVTHGFFTMDQRWRQWLKAQAWEAVFHHRSDFIAAYPAFAQEPLPLVLRRDGTDHSVALSAAQLRAAKDVNALVAAIEGALA